MSCDRENMLGVLNNFPRQCREASAIAGTRKVGGAFAGIAVCGMGGSGIGGELLKSFAAKLPVFVHHGYGLSPYINKKSLVFAVSYSGDTEETLSAFAEARKRGAKIVSITSGGRLARLDKSAIIVPGGLQPREAVGYLFLPILIVLSNSGLVPRQDAAIKELLKALKPAATSKQGLAFARRLKGKIPVFYASDRLGALAYRMKAQINENVKSPAFSHVIPEMNHNEINGFKRLSGRLAAVFIRDREDHPRIQKRMAVSKAVLAPKVRVLNVDTRGASLLARMLTTLYLGDFMSYHLALLNNEDPTPIPFIQELKKRLMR